MKNKLIKLLGEDWGNNLHKYLNVQNFNYIGEFLNTERLTKKIHPPKEDIFNAFKFTPFNKVEVVFLSTDPYVHENEAYGVAFGIKEDYRKIPFSLGIIQKEVEDSIYNGLNLGFDYTLKSWCNQGCFMYNIALTVEEKKIGSHLKKWELFTESVIKTLNDKEFCIFVLLGKDTQRYERFIQEKESFHILKVPHPSTSGFYGSKIFSKINLILKNNGRRGIIW